VILCGLASTLLTPRSADSQGLTGALIGTVKDAQGGIVRGAEVQVSSDALIGGPTRQPTNDKGQLRFPALPPGVYTMEIRFGGFAPYHEEGIAIGSGMTIAREVVLTPAGVSESVTVDGAASRIDARDPGFATRFGPEDLRAIPSRRSSMFDALRNVPGVSPTSPSSGTETTISAFGSGTNENQFLIDGTNMTCPCNGVSRSEPGVDAIQEVQVQGIGASAEYGNVQGAVINVIMRQGSERFAFDASYYGQPHDLTSQPMRLPYGNGQESGYERARYRDFTTNLGGPAIPQRLWFFGGYQYLRDYASQPGTDPHYPKTYEQNKVFAKLTWRLAPDWQLMQSYHEEFWVSPDQPTIAQPIETTTRSAAHVPAMTFGDLTHTVSPKTVWEVRAGQFTYDLNAPPTNGNTSTASHIDAVTGAFSGAPPAFNGLYLRRTVVKGTVSHYRAGWWGADHAWKMGAQVERGEHHSYFVIPTGVRYVDSAGAPTAATYSDPWNTGAVFLTTGLFVTDQITIGDRLTLSGGLRFDRSRAGNQDLPRVDGAGHETSDIVPGSGTLFTWNILSPRLGVTMKLDGAGHTILRASYGRFAQGVLTGEIGGFHPGVMPLVTRRWVAADNGYTQITQYTDRNSVVLDPDLRAPRTDEYSIGVDREIGARFQVAAAFVRKSGANFIGWQDIGGIYDLQVRTLADGRTIDVYNRRNAPTDQRYLLTNPAGYGMTYNGLVMALEKRRAHGWQAFGSYTFSRATGLQPGSGGIASAAQVSTVAPPPGPSGLTFGRDPNDLTNARGLLPNDRPHILRAMSSVDVPRTGFTIAANYQYFSGKPWTATANVALSQNPNQRILIEPRGSRRLSSQSLLDLRISRPIAIAPGRRIELLFDILNALNDAAEESIVTDTLVTESIKANPSFGKPNTFVDPRRVMLGIRVNLGKS
jgi:hypothetical protein